MPPGSCVLPWFKTYWLLQRSHTLTSRSPSTSAPPHAPEFPGLVKAEQRHVYLHPKVAPQTLYPPIHFPWGALHTPTACLMHTSWVGFFRKKRQPFLFRKQHCRRWGLCLFFHVAVRGESTSPRRVRTGLSSLLHLRKLEPTCSSSQNEKCAKCQHRLELAFLH